MGYTVSKTTEDESDNPQDWWIEINVDPAVGYDGCCEDEDIFDSSKLN